MRHCRYPHLVLALGLFLYLGGCKSHYGDPCIRISVPNKYLEIWSYSPISTTQIDGVDTGQKGFVRLIVAGKDATIVLQNGSKIHIADRVTINGTNIPTSGTLVRSNGTTVTTTTLDVFVGAQGEVELKTFIRTFD